jgi:hypothetical protein
MYMPAYCGRISPTAVLPADDKRTLSPVRYRFEPFISENTFRKFWRKPTSCADTSDSPRAVAGPTEKPVPTGLSIHSTLERFVHAYWFGVGFAWPYCHEIGPLPWRKPSRDEQPGPPFSQLD